LTQDSTRGDVPRASEVSLHHLTACYVVFGRGQPESQSASMKDDQGTQGFVIGTDWEPPILAVHVVALAERHGEQGLARG
jgi:hypothetical protein